MSSFTANSSVPPIAPDVVIGTFWPAVVVADLREAVRIPGDVTPQRLRAAIVSAGLDVTRELATWQEQRQACGYLTLADVPAPLVDGTSRLIQLFVRAVYSATAVQLNERYRAYDATAQGNQRADDLTPTIDELRRDLRNAISDLQGLRRVTVELI